MLARYTPLYDGILFWVSILGMELMSPSIWETVVKIRTKTYLVISQNYLSDTRLPPPRPQTSPPEAQIFPRVHLLTVPLPSP